MEWSNDRVLALVHAYRDNTVLWDSNSPIFKIKSRRDQAWEEVASRLGTDVLEVKKKMNSVLASFRRERSKVLKSGTEYDEAYESKWFAFDSFRFLMDKSAPKQHDDVEAMIDDTYNIQGFDCSTIIKSEMENQSEQFELRYSAPVDENLVVQDQSADVLPDSDDVEFNASYKKPRTIVAKRKCQCDDARASSLYKLARKLNSEYDKRDVCKVFGEYLAFKLRSYDFRTRAIVQHLINNVVFNADMGKYSKGEVGKGENDSSKNNDNISELADDKIASQDIDYLQEISDIVSDGKHFLDA